ncbi:MAG: Ig-like domain-containing protein [Acutalibacteraceae bacterium]|nr:Ig-like domain-containing protein [Acutalibacteraceae bacterium]
MLKKSIAFIVTIILTLSSVTLGFSAADAIDAKVKEYIAAPSQYTNNPTYGSTSEMENTLSSGGAVASLGNFGGYVIYEFNQEIDNSSSHRYGIDFTISGNAFNGAFTTQEPGQVWVSQDGNNWYALAGSEHYEDETVWDYSVTYHNMQTNTSTYTDSLGESGNVGARSPYPSKEVYTTVDFDENSVTLSGVLLRKNLTSSPSNGISTSFGYVDALNKSSAEAVSNPYIENPSQNGSDGQFDISWAVDGDGMPVRLDRIKYVKVQTATFIDSGVFGEKSTEISKFTLADEEDFINSKANVEITVNGQKVVFDGNNFCKLEGLENGVDIKVAADSANVYINNERTSEKKFAEAPEKGLVRIIVQSGDGEPQIFMLDISSALPETELSISDNEIELTRLDSKQITANLSDVIWSTSDENVAYVSDNGTVFAVGEGTAIITASTRSGQTAECTVKVLPDSESETVTVTFSVCDGTNFILPEAFSVRSGTAKAYGYNVASTDHNGKSVDGVTVFDVIVAAHKQIYGSSFTRSTAENYLVMQSGFMLRAFSQGGASFGFLVNGTMPNDGIASPDYGVPTGYSCDTATVTEGDSVTFYAYQDTRYYSDMFAKFDCDSYTVAAGKKLKVNIKGYSLMEHGLETEEVINEKYLENLKNVDIYLYENGKLEKLGTTDRNGNLEIRLTEEGEYTLVAVRTADSEEAPTITVFSSVTVTAKTELWIVRAFKAVFSFLANLIHSIF